MIPVYSPYLTEKSRINLIDAYDSGWISSNGVYVEHAKSLLISRFGYKYCILTNSGTAATHLCAMSLRLKHPEITKVYTSAANYVAAYNSLLYNNYDWTIRCLDICELTWNLKLKRPCNANETVFSVPCLGNTVDDSNYPHQYPEDFCEGVFNEPLNPSKRKLCISISFYGNKNITCGEGGAFMTDDPWLYRKALLYHSQGQSKQRYIHDVLGYNYRMSNTQAAILCGQLEDYEEIKLKKKYVMDKYYHHLKSFELVDFQRTIDGKPHFSWLFAVRLKGAKSYSETEQYFRKHGVEVRPLFYSAKKHKHLNFVTDDDVLNKIHKEVVILPSGCNILESEQEHITKVCKSYAQLCNLVNI